MLKITVNEKAYESNGEETLLDLSKRILDNGSLVVGAYVNNKIKELGFVPFEDSTVKFISLSDADGIRIYQRSLSFIFNLAVKRVFPEAKVCVRHSLSKGLYVELENVKSIFRTHMAMIEDEMAKIVESAIPFIKHEMPVEEAIKLYEGIGKDFKAGILKYKKNNKVTIYECDGDYNYFYGFMVPDTSYIKWYNLVHYNPGIIIQHPLTSYPDSIPPFEEQSKIHYTHREAERWGDLLGVANVSSLNGKIESGGIGELINISEALHEKKIGYIADEITKKRKRVVLIAGPSSSGKTTTANRLKIQLMANGLRPVTISVDDYFVNRDKTPLDENGELDFESIYAVDLELFNSDLTKLIDGEEVELPVFNFHEGKREYKGKKLRITEDQPLIIEGIHGLNDLLTKDIMRKDKFKIYVSALTQLNIDDQNRIPTTDTRIIRRIVRDNTYRGHSATRTIEMWNSVRRGEDKNIFPFQEQADVVFNTAIIYELAVLKKHVMPLLEEITPENPVYSQAKRLRRFLNYIESIEDESLIPSTSILREFIGGSIFRE